MTETTPQPDDYLHLDLAEPDEVALESDTEIDTAPVSETAIEPQMQSDILESGDAQTSAAGQVTLLTDSLDDPNHSDEHVFLDFVHDPLSHPAQDPVDPSTDTIGDDDPNTDTRLSIDIDPQDPLQDIVIQRPFVHLLGNQSTPLGTLGWSPSSPQQVYGSLMDMELNRISSSSSLPSTTTEALSLASATPASMARTTAISTSPVSASPLVFEPTSTTSVTDGVASSNYITPDLIFQPSGIYVDERSDSEESGAGAGSSTSSGRPTKPVHPSILRPLTPEEVMVPIAVRRSNRARQPSSLAVQSSEYLLHSQGLYGSAAAVPAAAAPAPAPVPVERVTRSKKVYCYCQKPDDGNVMIQCDNCRQWFHGACVDITDETAEMMELKNEKFFCEPCDERVQAWRAIGSSGGGSSFTVYSDTHDCDLPTCLNEARPTSDYCSEECAIKGIELQATEAVMNKENIPPVVYIPSPKQASSSSSGAPSPSTQQTAPESPKVEQDPIRVTALKGLTESLMVVLEPKAAHDEPQGENNEPADKDSGSNAGVGCDAAVPGGSDTAVDAEHVGQLAAAIEKELYSFTASPGFAVCGKDYKAKYRSLFFNLKDKNNVNLRSRVVSGELEPHDLVRLSHEELANPELQNIAKEIRMRSIHDSVLTVEEEPYIKKTHKGEMSFVPRLSSVGGPPAVPYLDHADSDNGSSSSGVNGSGSDEHTSDNNGSSMDGIHNTSSNYNNNSSDTDGISNQSSSSNDRAFGSAIGAEEALNGKQDDENAHHSSQSTPTGSAATDVLDKLLARIQTNKRSGEEAAGDALAGDKRQRRMDLALDGNEFESLHSADSYLPREPSPYSPSPPGSPVVHSTTPRDSPPPFLLEDLQQAAGIDRKRQRSQRVLSTAWQGTVFMHQVAKFSAKAVQVGGRTLVGRQGKGTTGLAWSDVLAKDILVDGRIPIVAVETYVGQQRQSSTKEVVVVKFEVQGSSSDSSDHHHAEFDKLFEYFHTKQRNGVVPQKNRHVKDMYLVPLAAKGSLPEYLRGLVEDDVSVRAIPFSLKPSFQPSPASTLTFPVQVKVKPQPTPPAKPRYLTIGQPAVPIYKFCTHFGDHRARTCLHVRTYSSSGGSISATEWGECLEPHGKSASRSSSIPPASTATAARPLSAPHHCLA
ncbi:PHD finger protein 3 [Mortierella sp. AD031]|nr:PHD finger protein 3 [Mortierella sp. AD031]